MTILWVFLPLYLQGYYYVFMKNFVIKGFCSIKIMWEFFKFQEPYFLVCKIRSFGYTAVAKYWVIGNFLCVNFEKDHLCYIITYLDFMCSSTLVGSFSTSFSKWVYFHWAQFQIALHTHTRFAHIFSHIWYYLGSRVTWVTFSWFVEP